MLRPNELYIYCELWLRWIYGPKHVQTTLSIKRMYRPRSIPFRHYNYTVETNRWNQQSSYLDTFISTIGELFGPLKIEFIKAIKKLRPYSYTSKNQIIAYTADQRSFSNSKIFSSVLNLDYKIIYNFYIILISISCEHMIDAKNLNLYTILLLIYT